MKNEQLLSGIIGALIGGFVVWLFITNASSNNMTGMMGVRNISQNPMRNSYTLDAHFIEQMIPHHEDAITMAKLAQTKARQPEVKQLANSIIDSQGKEISQMKEWYKEWFGRDLPTGDQVVQHHGMGSRTDIHMGMMGDESDIARLEEAEDFDKAFLEEMIPHHQMAVMMASMLKNGTQRPEMKKLADDIINAQEKEIEQMRKWLNGRK